MEEVIGQFASLGAVGMITYYLFKNTMEEKKEIETMSIQYL